MKSRSLACDGGSPVRTRPWPKPHTVGPADEQRLLSALHDSNWSRGDLCAEFECTFASFCGVRYALLVTSGTAAIEVSLLACGIGPADEVIIPAMTWPSVAIAVMRTGAVPVPVDIETDSYAISPRTITPALNPRTRAIVATHLYCSLADVPAIMKLTTGTNIKVIEDSSQSIGAMRHGKRTGTHGHVGVFSLNQEKVLACGEGGCLVTSDEGLFKRAQSLSDVDPDVDEIPSLLPTTDRASEFHAALLLSQLAKLPSRLALIEERAELLRACLKESFGLEALVTLPATDLQSIYSFCFKVPHVDDIVWFRSALSQELRLRVSGGYRPLSETPVVDAARDDRFRGLSDQLKRPFPGATRAHHKEAVRFSHRVLLGDDEDISDIVTAIGKVLDAAERGQPNGA